MVTSTHANPKHWLISVLSILGGLMLMVFGTLGLCFVAGELIQPNERPTPTLIRRMCQQAPNLLLMLALPGGYILLRRGLGLQRLAESPPPKG